MCQRREQRSKETAKIIRAVKDRIIRDIKCLFEEEEDCYKPRRAGNFHGDIYIEYQNNGNRNKTLSIR